MEGTRVSTTLPLSFKGWNLSGLPEGKHAADQDTLFYWHNYAYSDPNKVNKGDIYPDSLLSDSRERDDVMEILNLRMPAGEGSQQDHWVGIQTLIQAGGADLVEREFLEVLVRGEVGVLHVDIGDISEDQVRKGQEPNNLLDSEDSNPADGTFIARDEDTGLDGLYSSQEPGYSSSTNPDPADDDFDYDETNYEDYTKVNKTEENRREDTEDLDGNGQLDVSSNYFSYRLPLSGQSAFVEGEYLNGWRLYRIPLEGYEREVGNADLSNVEYCRIWVDELANIDEEVWIQIAGLEIVGSNWLSEGIQATDGAPSSDERFRIKVRNNKENPEYTPPYDPGEDERTGYERREQSLVLAFENLKADHWGSAYQAFFRDQDYSGYSGIAFWVKPFQIYDDVGRTTNPMIWLRLGANETNYYEIRLRVSSDEWQKIEVSLDELTRTKVEGRVTMPEGFMLSVQGSPSITKTRRMTLGIENPTGRAITGEVWINDLQLVDVKRERGLARRTSVKVQLADLASVDADYRSLDATYRRLDQRGSTGATSSSTSGRVSTNVSLDQFLPDRWGFRLPLSLLWSWQLSRPRLAPGSDVVLTDRERRDKESNDTVNKLSVSLSKTKASRNAFVRATLDRIRLSYSKSSTKSKGPVRADTTVTERASLDWSWAPSKKSALKLPLVGFEFSYLPNSLSFGVSGQQKNPVTYVAQGDSLVWSPVKFSRTLTENVAAGMQPFKAVTANYSFSATRDLTYRSDSTGEDLLDDDTLRNTGDVLPFWKAFDAREMQRTQKISMQFKPRISSWLDPSLTYDTTYNENHDPALGAADSVDVRDVGSNTSRRLRATLSLSQLFSKLSKGAGERIVLFKGLASIGSKLQALQGSVGRTESSRFRGLYGRPGLSYQLGLQKSPAGAAPYDLSTKDSWDVSGGAQILKDLRLSTRGSGTDDRRYFSGTETGSMSITFPDLDLSWSGLHTVGPLKGRVMSSTVRSGYRITKGDRGKYENGDFTKSGESTKHDFSPRLSVSLRWKNGLTLTLSDSYSKDENRDLLQAQATTNTRTSHQSSVSLQYAFSAPQGMRLPIFGMMRFKSDLRLSFELSKDRTLDKTGDTIRSDTSSWSVRPGASYDFGVVDSGVQIWVSESNNRKLDQRRRNIGLRLWVEFPF
jgi:hypothetical protein